MQTGGAVWFQPELYDGSSLFLVASAPGLAVKIQCWRVAPDALVPLAPADPGDFSVAHGLGVTPVLTLVQMTSAGAIWQDTPEADATNLHLTASAEDLTGNAKGG